MLHCGLECLGEIHGLLVVGLFMGSLQTLLPVGRSSSGMKMQAGGALSTSLGCSATREVGQGCGRWRGRCRWGGLEV